METSAATDDGNNFCIISHLGSEKNHRNENEDRHKGQDQIQDPERIEIKQKIPYCKAVAFNPRRFCLHIHNHNDDRQKRQHKNEGSQIFFDDVKIYDFHRVII